MKKLFSFRSSAQNNEKGCGDAPVGSNGGSTDQGSRKSLNSSGNAKNLFSRPKTNEPRNQNTDPNSLLQRSRSFSSSSVFRGSVLGERTWNILVIVVVVVVMLKGSHDSSINTAHSTTPVPLRCGLARLAHVSNKVLDLYIDGEQDDGLKNSKTESSFVKSSSSNENAKGWRPPRVRSTGVASPTGVCGERVRSFSFREVKDACNQFPTRNLMRNELGCENKQELAGNVVERLSEVFPQEMRTKSWDFDVETPITVEDALVGYLNSHHDSNSDEVMQKTCLSDTISGTKRFCHGKDASCLQKLNHFLEDECTYIACMEEDDNELHRKVKEAEEKVLMLSKEHEQESIVQYCVPSVSELLQTIRDISEERRSLALDVLGQLQFRIAERTSAKEALRVAKAELDSQVQRLEKEKKELQLGLEKELDRRSSDWSSKLGKYHLEEQRLRERVRELAEQNVFLQREVSSLKGREVESISRMRHLEQQLKEMTESSQEAKKKNQDLQLTVSELQEQYQVADTYMDCMQRNYKNIENEKRELQKGVVRLQRTCSEQEKDYRWFAEGLNEELGRMDLSKNHDDHMHKLRVEQMRLTGMEQVLRREVETSRLEIESLRHENVNLLVHLWGAGSDGGSSSYKLDQELRDRLDSVQNQGLSLIHESNHLCEKLLDFIKQNKIQLVDNMPNVDNDLQLEARKHGLNGYFILELDVKMQNLSRGLENFTRSLKMVSLVLDEKPKLISEFQHRGETNGGSMKLISQSLEEDVNLRLEETLVTSLLREKLLTKQLELDQLQAELATTVAGREILKHEVQVALDALSCMSLKMKDLELQMLQKDESIKQLRSELQECTKELTFTKDVLPKVSKERDVMWEEVKQYSEKNMLLNSELKLLKKEKETLEEDILMKEGQITILKDSLGNKPFNIFYKPNSRPELAE
ncbi:hypothetical protein Sjap_015947 [Stephania japonica]|uniref:DUF7653 domain-containing protein n=1 Tax=Stephania japonica TaxID=461633 RepID=A0AAP0IKX5_9MAGN